MKRERRHELQHNDLAEWILKGYERIVPYKNAILGASLLLVVLVIAAVLWHSHSVAEAGEAWNSLGVPVQPHFDAEQWIDVMAKTAQTYPGTEAAQWAEVFAADTALMCGTNRILTEKKNGIKYLTDAKGRYAKALETLTIKGAQEQALFGKARAIESLIENTEQLKEATAAYQELIDKFPQGMYKPIADQRIERLQKPETLKFYEALAKYKGEPRKTESPQSPLESPRSQLEKMGTLRENPPGEPLMPDKPPVRSEGPRTGPPGIPGPSSTPIEPDKPPTPKAETPKTPPAKTDAVKPDAAKPETVKPQPAKPDTPKPEAPKKDK